MIPAYGNVENAVLGKLGPLEIGNRVLVRFLAVVALCGSVDAAAFTGGACTREFDEEGARTRGRRNDRRPGLATAWSARKIP